MQSKDVSEEDIFTEITSLGLSLETLTAKVEDRSAGAVATFTGVTRDHFNGKTVEKLEYEAYEPMARKKLQERTFLPTELPRCFANSAFRE